MQEEVAVAIVNEGADASAEPPEKRDRCDYVSGLPILNEPYDREDGDNVKYVALASVALIIAFETSIDLRLVAIAVQVHMLRHQSSPICASSHSGGRMTSLAAWLSHRPALRGARMDGFGLRTS